MDPLAAYAPSHEVVRALAGIDHFKGLWRGLARLDPDRIANLRRIATIESVGSSTRIEGARLSDREVEELLSGMRIRSFGTRDEQEVAGYSETVELILESYEHMPLDENHLKQLHGNLLRHSIKDERHRGHYKTLPNHVEAFDQDGRSLGVVFQTTSPLETPGRMEVLLTWTRDELEQETYHPLLVIAVFVVRFLAIHPFQDGNGRLSRLLTTLLLLRQGYAYVPYASLERVIEQRRRDYYVALRRTQATLDADESSLEAWILFFLRALEVQAGALQNQLEQEKQLEQLPELARQILEIARQHGRVTPRDAAALTGASIHTIKAHLKRLTSNGELKRYGVGRGTWYGLG